MPFAIHDPLAIRTYATPPVRTSKRKSDRQAAGTLKCRTTNKKTGKAAAEKATPQQLERARARTQHNATATQRVALDDSASYNSTQETISATPDDLTRSLKKRKRQAVRESSISNNTLIQSRSAALSDTEQTSSEVGQDPIDSGDPKNIVRDLQNSANLNTGDKVDAQGTQVSHALSNIEFTFPSSALMSDSAGIGIPGSIDVVERPDMVPASIEQAPLAKDQILEIKRKLVSWQRAHTMDADQVADLIHDDSSGNPALSLSHELDCNASTLRSIVPKCTMPKVARDALRTTSNRFIAREYLSKDEFIKYLHHPDQEDLELFWMAVKSNDRLEYLFENEVQNALDEIYPVNWLSLPVDASSEPRVIDSSLAASQDPLDRSDSPDTETCMRKTDQDLRSDSLTESETDIDHLQVASSQEYWGQDEYKVDLNPSNPRMQTCARDLLTPGPGQTPPGNVTESDLPVDLEGNGDYQLPDHAAIEDDRAETVSDVCTSDVMPKLEGYAQDGRDEVLRDSDEVSVQHAGTCDESPRTVAESEQAIIQASRAWQEQARLHSARGYITGPLSQQERAIVQQAVDRVKIDFSLDGDEFCKFVHESTRKEKKTFWSQLIYCLPERRPKNLREYIKKAFRPVDRREPFSSAEKVKLRELVSVHGKAWTQIGQMMKRYREDCQQTYRRMEQAKAWKSVDGPWSSAELDALAKAITKYGTDVPDWAAVATQVGTRTPRQCIDRSRIHTRRDKAPLHHREQMCEESQDKARKVTRQAQPEVLNVPHTREQSSPLLEKKAGMSHQDLISFVDYLLELPLKCMDEFDLPSDLGPFERFGYDELRSAIATQRIKIRNWRTKDVQEILHCIKDDLLISLP